MTAEDQKKVCMVGFTIIRRQDTPKPQIKYKNSSSPDAWKRYGNYFQSKAERDRKVKELLEKNYYVED